MLIFVHVPEFYAAVEQADHPVTDRALIVGGDPRKGGTVISANAEARAAGVLDGMELGAAQALCPSAELRVTRLRRYREVAAELRALLRGACERIEPEGLDGCYLEPVPGEDATTLAARLCVQIRAELGVRATAGIAASRFVAHLAARRAGEAGLQRVDPDQSIEFLAPLPVSAIWGLGPASAEKLRRLGVERIGQLQTLELATLREAIGERNAAQFLELARGEDRGPLRPARPLQSLSRAVTLSEPSSDLRALGEEIGRLALAVEEMLRRERRNARTVTLAVGFVDGERVSRAVTVNNALREPGEIASLARELLARTQAGARQVRRLRLQVSKLEQGDSEATPQQLRLF